MVPFLNCHSVHTNNLSEDLTDAESKVWSLLKNVSDPEIPVISIVDLGIIRQVTFFNIDSATSQNNNPPSFKNIGICITITPTYSGCPVMDVIATHIRMELLQHGFKEVKIKTVLSPPWTTEWITETGRQKLKAFGIAPPNPQQSVCSPDAFQQDEAVQCPQCNSFNTQLISRFGSTACKALYKCNNCNEPFDYFKCH